jgi:hypothetical protein
VFRPISVQYHEQRFSGKLDFTLKKCEHFNLQVIITHT